MTSPLRASCWPPLALAFILGACGTETGNPEPISLSLGDSKVFFSRAPENQSFLASLSRLALSAADDPKTSGAPLLKLTPDGEIVSAVTTDSGSPADLPSVIRIERLSNGKTYLLFERFVTIGKEVCQLVEVDADDQARCIDSLRHQASDAFLNTRLPYAEMQGYLFVWADSSGDVFYTSRKPVEGSFFQNRVSVRRSNGSWEDLTPDDWAFERVIRATDGTVFGIGCARGLGQTSPAVYCRSDESTVTDLTGAIDRSSSTVALIRNDRLVTSSDKESFNLLVGPLGSTITQANFSTDLKANPVTVPLTGGFPVTPDLFVAGDEAIFATADYLPYLFRFAPTIAEVTLPGIDSQIDGVDTIDGAPIALVGCHFDDGLGEQTCTLHLVNPGTLAIDEIPLPGIYQTYSLRYSDADTLFIAGEDVATFGTETTYYRYRLDEGRLEQVLSVTGSSYFIQVLR